MGEAEAQSAEFRSELERVLASQMFRNSDAVHRLLAYLGERSLAGETAGLKEFTIGVEAFHKPPDYSPQEDPIVRVLASKLRHKLGDYYRTEGADHPVRIDIPKGRYQLMFLVRPAEPSAAPAADPGSELRQWRRISWALAVTLGVVVLLVAYWRLSMVQPPAGAARSASGWNAELELFWQPYLEGNRPTLIVFGAPLFTKFSGGFFRDPKLNQWEEAEPSGRVRLIQKALESPYAHPSFNFTGIGETNGVFLLSKLLLAKRPDLLLKKSTALTWDDIGTHNVIFLGSPKFNVHLKDLPFEQDFVIEGGSVQNLRPRPGEPAKFKEVRTPSHSAILEDYALVTRLPGLHGRGYLSILAASSTEGTWAATEYVTEREHAKEIVARLRLPSGKLPDAFQILIRAKFKDMVPVETSYVTHRVLAAGGNPPVK
jgi:hypothetical protein